jgi:hypothetical protein
MAMGMARMSLSMVKTEGQSRQLQRWRESFSFPILRVERLSPYIKTIKAKSGDGTDSRTRSMSTKTGMTATFWDLILV